MKKTLRLFFLFCLRELYVFKGNMKQYFVNYAILTPIYYAVAFGYLLPLITLGTTNPMNITLFFGGTVLMALQIVSFVINLEMLKDIDSNRHINYQLLFIHPSFLVLQRIFVATSLSVCALLPFYPIAKLILQDHFYTVNIQVIKLLGMIVMGSTLCASINMFLCCITKNFSHVPKFWTRLYSPLILTGGTFVPWALVKQKAPLLGKLLLANPMIYISEGIRSALTANPAFLSPSVCIVMLSLFSGVLIFFSMRCFKRKMNPWPDKMSFK